LMPLRAPSVSPRVSGETTSKALPIRDEFQQAHPVS
jgi:hypothetical protein